MTCSRSSSFRVEWTGGKEGSKSENETVAERGMTSGREESRSESDTVLQRKRFSLRKRSDSGGSDSVSAGTASDREERSECDTVESEARQD